MHTMGLKHRVSLVSFRGVRVIIVLILLSPATGTIAQHSEWMVYTMDNSGLPSNTIPAIAFDARGRLWVGTGDGLSLFTIGPGTCIPPRELTCPPAKAGIHARSDLDLPNGDYRINY